MKRAKILTKTIVSYACSVCGSQHSTLEKAQKHIESYLLESARFAVGDPVRGLGQICCLCSGGFFFPVGKVVRVVGPIAGNKTSPDGRRLICTGAHVYLYDVNFTCPSCFRTREKQFYTSDIELLPLETLQSLAAIGIC